MNILMQWVRRGIMYVLFMFVMPVIWNPVRITKLVLNEVCHVVQQKKFYRTETCKCTQLHVFRKQFADAWEWVMKRGVGELW